MPAWLQPRKTSKGSRRPAPLLWTVLPSLPRARNEAVLHRRKALKVVNREDQPRQDPPGHSVLLHLPSRMKRRLS
jgi:hypothetical protein